jgi:hypothetical protein
MAERGSQGWGVDPAPNTNATLPSRRKRLRQVPFCTDLLVGDGWTARSRINESTKRSGLAIPTNLNCGHDCIAI